MDENEKELLNNGMNNSLIKDIKAVVRCFEKKAENVSNTIELSFKDNTYSEYNINLENVDHFQFIPCHEMVCIVSDLKLYTRNGAIYPSFTNGIQLDNGYVFTGRDPLIEYIVPSGCSIQNKFGCIISIVSDSSDIACQLSKVKKLIEKLESEQKALTKQIEILNQTMQKNLFSFGNAGRDFSCFMENNYTVLKDLGKREEQYKNRISELTQELLALEKENIIQKENLDEQSTRISDFSNKTTEYEAKIHSSEESLLKCFNRCNELENSLNETVKQRDEILENLLRITSGFWWRITAPGRRISRLVKHKKDDVIHQEKVPKNIISNLNDDHCISNIIPGESLPTNSLLCIDEVYKDTNHPVWSLPIVYIGEHAKRLNLVTDTIDSSSLLGGVATSLIVATQFCYKNDYELRIITRMNQPNPINYENIIDINNLSRPKKVSYYTDFPTGNPAFTNYKLEIGEGDVFLATSWWSAESIRRTIPNQRFFYIIQEVESFFYNHGGEMRMCEEIMQDKNIDFIINSSSLNEYFKLFEPNVWENGVYFEPAFSSSLFSRKDYQHSIRRTNEKHRIFFYGRPNNPRNLFNYGVRILNKAIASSIIDTGEWEICFAGASVPPITFCDGSQSVNMGLLSWTDYSDFLNTVDLAFCLMYTPHPSYPPYDAACSGCVVVTNKYLTKQTFDKSDNVIITNLTDGDLLNGIREGIKLALDEKKRKLNYERSTIPRIWDDVLPTVMDFMERKITWN